MARKPRIEIPGGLYHLITRGNNRGRIFRSDEDHQKFLGLLFKQKAKCPLYLYAYCLMPNHVHLLVEMIDDPISVNSKGRGVVMLKEAIILVASESGIRTGDVAKTLVLAPSAVSKRRDSARTRALASEAMKALLKTMRSLLASNVKCQA